jgi:hypothetical protein
LAVKRRKKERMRQRILLRKDNTLPLPHTAWFKTVVFSIEQYNI